MSIARDRKPVKFTCEFVSIVVRINDVRYAVDPIDPGEDGTRAFRLCKASGDHEVYDVIRTHAGLVECSCPSYEATHRGTASTCKHGRALVELGLMPAPAPRNEEIVPRSAACCSPAEAEPCATCVGAPNPPEIEASIPAPVDPWDVESDPEAWGPETDAPALSLLDDDDDRPSDGDLADCREMKGEAEARGHLDASERLTLVELIERQQSFYEGWGNAAGRMFAAAMAELAFKARLTSASTPDELAARSEQLDADARAQWEAVGYDRAMAESGERAACLGGYGHLS